MPLIVLAAMAYGVLFTPAFALIADGAEQVGLAQGMAFGFMNAAWAVGAMIGPAAGGAIAGATGDWIPFVLAAALCASRARRARAQLMNAPPFWSIACPVTPRESGESSQATVPAMSSGCAHAPERHLAHRLRVRLVAA